MIFPPGQIVSTPGALQMLEEKEIEPITILNRHLNGDFGKEGIYSEINPTLTPKELEEGPLATDEGGRLNSIAIRSGMGRVISMYNDLDTPEEIWVITYIGTEQDHTTILLPSEY